MASAAKGPRGAIAAGHPETVAAARRMLEQGGNAFDAAVAAICAACVCEPILASLGGGGFMLAHDATGNDLLHDFFVHTPGRHADPESLDFFPIQADFGTTTQEFHIGRGAIAVPGVIKGIFEVHRRHCKLPLPTLFAPARELARRGVEINTFQAYILRIIAPILEATNAAKAQFASPKNREQIITEGETFRLPQFADFLDALAEEGEALFYRGEVARRIISACAEHSSLTLADLKNYRVMHRSPLSLRYRGRRILTNPPPSTGGILIAFALKLLETSTLESSDPNWLTHLAQAMEITNFCRQQSHVEALNESLLDEEHLRQYRAILDKHPLTQRGTTHISVADHDGNLASVTLSNGEGCGHIVEGTGIMLNNMLGEEDLNPDGFQRWRPDTRLASMMAPSFVFDPEGRTIVLGSGGSNRIRTAILQTLIRLIDFDQPLKEAIDRPRIHFENGSINLEPGFELPALEQLERDYPKQKQWDEINLFFGGVHGVEYDPRCHSFSACGDPRRGGSATIL